MTRRFPPSVGGMENFAFDLYSSLAKKIDVVLVKWGRTTKALPVILPYFLVRGFIGLATQRNIDIIHAQDGVLAPIGWLFSKIFRKPYTVVIHGLDITFKNKLFQTVVPWAVNRAEVVFCISQAAADEVIKRGGDPDKIRVIPLGITDENHGSRDEARHKLSDEVGIGQDAPVLITVGRLVKRKGVAWFVENVMPTLAKHNADIRYLIVGSGEERDKIESAIAKNDLHKQVRMLGRVPDEMMPVLYNGADVFVQPNIRVAGDMEGFGRVLLEASLCELPVVASGIEGITEAITHEGNGILVDSADKKAFVKEIEAFTSAPKHARTFGKKSREFTLRKFQWADIAARYIENFNEVKKGHER